ncbi:TRPM8 channel-associated factor homolog [Xenopus tropicalis]|uniref:TRPM8 channel-associated factor 2 n=1 Tax=Xenopus tropicalis TaxID=8364 RepID=A0A6I8PYI9_XENTR|nr:TRPM8 channel-associated factor homolog [Xenopus tropicalis]
MTFDEDYRSLVHGVGFLEFSGGPVPCKLLVTGDTAFPVVVTPRKDVLIAASRYGKGKMVVIAHEGYLNMKEFKDFLQNVITWISPNPESVIGIHNRLNLLAETLSASDYKVKKTTGLTEGLGVFCTNGYDDSQAQKIISFVRDGGGLLIGAQAWNWAHNHKQENVLHNFPGNKITSVSGVYFNSGTGEKGKFCLTENIPRSSIYTHFDFSVDLKHLLDGVSHFDIRGQAVPSDIFLHGTLTFPIGQSDNKQCFLAAAFYGKGRVIVAAHESYLTKPELKTFILNALSWLDLGQNRKIGVHRDLGNFAEFLKNENISSQVSDLDSEMSVYCCQSVSDNEVEAIHQFVAEGGGLFLADHAWNWSSENVDKNVLIDYTGNKVLNKFGISILEWTIPQGNYKANQSGGDANQYNFLQTISQLKIQDEPKVQLSTWLFKLIQDINGFMKLPTCPLNTAIRLQYEELLENCNISKTSKQTQETSSAKQALVLCLAHEAEILKQKQDLNHYVEKEPSIIVEIDATNPGKDAHRSTGLYIYPKKMAVVEFPASAVHQGLQVHIGCDSDNLNVEEYCHAPVMHTISVVDQRVSVSCLWGGPLDVIVKAKSNLGKIPVKVFGAVPTSTVIKEKRMPNEDYQLLIRGVGCMDFSRDATPCKLLLTGNTAFPIMVTPKKDVLIAASRYGKGKLVAIAHENYLNMKEFMLFIQNAISWLSPNSEAIIGVHNAFGLLSETLTVSGCKVQTSSGLTDGIGVFCTNGYDDSQAQQIISFVRKGGGLLIGAQACEWSNSNTGRNVLQHFPGNKIASVSGVYFTEHYGEKGKFILSENMPQCPIYTDFDSSVDLKHLLNGVSQIDISGLGIHSDLLLHGALSFPVGLTDKKQCFLAAAYYGKGHVVVATHEGFFFKPEMKTIILNAISWLDNRQDRKIGVEKNLTKLAELLQKENIPCNISKLVPELSVYCCSSYSDTEAKAIHQFVAEGGGLLIAGHAWYWHSQNPDCNVLTHYPGNKILNKFGISILNNTIPRGSYKSIYPDKDIVQYNLPKAFCHLENEMQNESELKPSLAAWLFKLKQDMSHFLKLPGKPVTSSMQCRFLDMMQACDVPNVSKKCPVSSCSKQGLILCLAHDSFIKSQMSDLVKNLEQEPSVTVKIDTTNPGNNAWRSTGLYLAPKKAALLEFPASAVKQGFQVQVGCHSDDLSSKDEFCRAPIVVHKTFVTSEKVSVSCYWGGLLYIIVKANSNFGTIPVKVYGAEPAPCFIKGKTSLANWTESNCNLPAPWAELITENIILTVPSDAIRSLSDPEELLAIWDRMMVAISELAAIPAKFPRPERIVADVQLTVGWMHSGYPVMCHMEAATGLTDANGIQKNGIWGAIHELGHNQQKTNWEFPPHTTEATCNLWSVYVHETVLGIPRNKAHTELQPETRTSRIQRFLQNGSDLKTWSMWTALETYLQLQEGFGWEPFKQLFKDYQSMSGISNDNKSKMNLWAEKFSEAVQTNLIPFFEAWGWPIEEATHSKLSALPVWEKDPMKPYLSPIKS